MSLPTHKFLVNDLRRYMDKNSPGWRDVVDSYTGMRLGNVQVTFDTPDGSITVMCHMDGGFEGERIDGMEYDDVDW
jgi:hypothetical protein